MFLHVSVILFMGGGGIPAYIAGGIPACLAAGMGGVVSQHALQVSRPTPRGYLGPHLGGGVSQHALRQTPPFPTATAAGGTHPTGMHSF